MKNRKSLFITIAMTGMVLLLFSNINWKNYFIMSIVSLLILNLFRLRCAFTKEVTTKYTVNVALGDVLVAFFPVFNGLIAAFLCLTLFMKRSTFIEMAKDY